MALPIEVYFPLQQSTFWGTLRAAWVSTMTALSWAPSISMPWQSQHTALVFKVSSCSRTGHCHFSHNFSERKWWKKRKKYAFQIRQLPLFSGMPTQQPLLIINWLSQQQWEWDLQFYIWEHCCFPKYRDSFTNGEIENGY